MADVHAGRSEPCFHISERKIAAALPGHNLRCGQAPSRLPHQGSQSTRWKWHSAAEKKRQISAVRAAEPIATLAWLPSRGGEYLRILMEEKRVRAIGQNQLHLSSFLVQTLDQQLSGAPQVIEYTLSDVAQLPELMTRARGAILIRYPLDTQRSLTTVALGQGINGH